MLFRSMTVDLSWSSNKTVGGLQVERTTKYSNYKFDPIEQRLFRLKGSVIKEADMLSKSDEYWASVRQVPLTKTESTMDVFVNRLEQIPGFKYIIFGAKAVIENFVEALQKKNQVVAVTGDGTNDAPALHTAHVGLSMGDGTSEIGRAHV